MNLQQCWHAQKQHEENEQTLRRSEAQRRHARAALHQPHPARKRRLLTKYTSELE